MHFELVNVQIGHPRYEELVGQIRADTALRQRMWLEAEHRFEELPGKVWSFALVNVRGQWVPAAWAAARPVGGVLECSDNYERPGFRGPDLGRIGWGLYPEAYRYRHATMVLPSALPAKTFVFDQPRKLHEADGWEVVGSGTSHEVEESHDWWELYRCCGHPLDQHDPDEGCLHGWTDTETGCPCRPAPKAVQQVGVLDRITAAMAASGATDLRFRRVAGSHDRRWRRNR